jgi:hypothetical protein
VDEDRERPAVAQRAVPAAVDVIVQDARHAEALEEVLDHRMRAKAVNLQHLLAVAAEASKYRGARSSLRRHGRRFCHSERESASLKIGRYTVHLHN